MGKIELCEGVEFAGVLMYFIGNERNRIEYLFELYEAYTLPLMKEEKEEMK